MRKVIELKLPFPPSVNEMFFNVPGRGRVKTSVYKQWLEEAGWQLKAQKPQRIEDRATIHVDLDDTRRGDADNRAKALLDLLVTHGVLAGDSKKHVKRISIGWETVSGCRVAIEAA